MMQVYYLIFLMSTILFQNIRQATKITAVPVQVLNPVMSINMFYVYCILYTGVILLSCSSFSATQIAVIGAIILVIADIISLIAALAADNEYQQSKTEEKRAIEDEIKRLQDKLRKIN